MQSVIVSSKHQDLIIQRVSGQPRRYVSRQELRGRRRQRIFRSHVPRIRKHRICLACSKRLLKGQLTKDGSNKGLCHGQKPDSPQAGQPWPPLRVLADRQRLGMGAAAWRPPRPKPGLPLAVRLLGAPLRPYQPWLRLVPLLPLAPPTPPSELLPLAPPPAALLLLPPPPPPPMRVLRQFSEPHRAARA